MPCTIPTPENIPVGARGACPSVSHRDRKNIVKYIQLQDNSSRKMGNVDKGVFQTCKRPFLVMDISQDQCLGRRTVKMLNKGQAFLSQEKDLRNHTPAWHYSNLPQGPVGLLGQPARLSRNWGTGVQGARLRGLGFLPTSWYLSYCAAGSHLPLSTSHLPEPPPTHSALSSPVGPGTFACRLAGEREGSQTSLWSLVTDTLGSSLCPSHAFPALQVPH